MTYLLYWLAQVFCLFAGALVFGTLIMLVATIGHWLFERFLDLLDWFDRQPPNPTGY